MRTYYYVTTWLSWMWENTTFQNFSLILNFYFSLQFLSYLFKVESIRASIIPSLSHSDVLHPHQHSFNPIILSELLQTLSQCLQAFLIQNQQSLHWKRWIQSGPVYSVFNSLLSNLVVLLMWSCYWLFFQCDFLRFHSLEPVLLKVTIDFFNGCWHWKVLSPCTSWP